MVKLYIVWLKEYNCGITILDEQHRGLVSLINSFFFHKDDAERDINAFLVPTAEMFKNYIKINYNTLKKLLIDSDYDKIDDFYKQQHEIMHTIDREDLKYRRNRDADGLLNFLKTYWLKHARCTNYDYLRHIREYYGDTI